jgi:hypothetical protein
MLDLYYLIFFMGGIAGTFVICGLVQFAIIYYFKGRHAAIQFLKEEF